jgi:hypothetical protein
MRRGIAGRGQMAWTAAFFLAGLWVCDPAFADSKAASVCDSDDDDSGPKPAWKQFAIGKTCVELSGTVSLIYQKLMNTTGSRVPALSTRQGVVTGDANFVNTGDFNFRVDTTRKTSLGDFTTGIEVQYERISGDSGNNAFTLIEGVVSWAGATVGYTDSLMDFWSGDFQFSATSPDRTIGLFSYEHKLSDTWKWAVSLETGVPTTQDDASAFMPIYPDDPVLATRLRYVTDELTLHGSGMIHELKGDGSQSPLVRRRHASAGGELGWAASFGLTQSLPKISKGSEFSMQATYAVNASAYLGTTADLSSLVSFAPVDAVSRGWSVVGSYHHVFSQHWEANIMASRLSLELTLPFMAPTIDTTRYAANLIWKPKDNLEIGGELGLLDATLQPNGTAGLLSGGSGSSLVGYLFLTWTF